MHGSSTGREAMTADGARGEGLCGEVVTVDVLAGQRREQATGLNVTRVEADRSGDRHQRVAVHLPAHHVGDLGDRHDDHASACHSISSRSTVRSSKGWTTPSIS